MKEPWRSARDCRELAIMKSNRTHPLNRASAVQLTKGWGGCPPSVLHVIALVEAGLDRQARRTVVVSSLHEAIREQVELMTEMWKPKRAMRYLMYYQEEDYPTDAVNLVQQAQTPLDAAMELIEIVKQNLVVSGVEIDPPTPWR